MDLGERVQLVEEGHPQREIGVGEELHRLRLGRAGEEHRHVGVERALRQQSGEAPGLGRAVAHHDARGMEVVVQRAPLAQELGREEDPVRAMLGPHPLGEAHRDGRFHHDGGAGRMVQRLGDHLLDRRGVEAVGAGVVVGGRRDDDVVGPFQRLARVGRGRQLQPAAGQEGADVGILDGRGPRVHLPHPRRVDVQGHHLMRLRQQHGKGKPDIAKARDSNLHG